ncbi:MAG: DUF4397 domain-containing protein [Woeseiaceae bacterium]
MKRIFLLVACLGALFVSACGGDSNFPTPTGEGSIRMINAIPGSPVVFFLIEERLLEEVPYQRSSSPVTYDNFSYVFNFEIRYPGDLATTRVASQELQVEADGDHIFLLTGDVNAPTVTTWSGDRRSWDQTETVFEARFSHASATLGDIDVYFDAPGTVPGTNPPVATLSLGEIGDPRDFEEGSYVITVTAAGDVDTVYFTSDETSLLPRFAHVISVFDGDGDDTAPVVVESMTSVGNPLSFPDPTYPPKLRFVHSAYSLESVDIYDDELLTNLVASDVAFGAATADLDTTSELKSYYFTPANSQATILFDYTVGAQPLGSFRHLYLIGDIDSWLGATAFPSRARSALGAKVTLFHAAFNQQRFNVYVKDRGELLVEDDVPATFAAFSFYNSSLQLAPGSYDLYLTEQDSKTEITAEPFQIDVAIGDIVDLIAVDTVDPVLIQLIEVPVP